MLSGVLALARCRHRLSLGKPTAIGCKGACHRTASLDNPWASRDIYALCRPRQSRSFLTFSILGESLDRLHMEPKRAVVITYGCQMNKYESERMAGILVGLGYEITSQARSADLILLNTCS